jgi:hypothetical protein
VPAVIDNKMLRVLIILIISALSLSVHAQSDGEQIVNAVINNEEFVKHLSNQEIINLEKVNYVLSNKHVETSWQLSFQNNDLKFNTEFGTTSKGFERGYDFEIISLHKKRKRSNITLRFYPSYYSCSDDGVMVLGQAFALYIELDAELLKENGAWVLSNCDISDDSFDLNKSKFPCICENYIRIEDK